MKSERFDGFKKACSKYFCSLWRQEVSRDELFGIPLLINEHLLLLAEYDIRSYTFEGYSVIRTADIIDDSTIYDSRSWYPYLVQKKLKIESPIAPIPLRNSFAEQLALIGSSSSLFIIEKKYSHENIDWIGKLVKLTSKTLFLAEIDSDAEWIGTYQHRIGSISRIIWSDPYSILLNKVTNLSKSNNS